MALTRYIMSDGIPSLSAEQPPGTPPFAASFFFVFFLFLFGAFALLFAIFFVETTKISGPFSILRLARLLTCSRHAKLLSEQKRVEGTCGRGTGED